MSTRNRFVLSATAALVGAAVLTAVAADPPPEPRPCRELTGDERTKCEQQAREQDPSRKQTPPPAADEKEPPPPDTESESDEHSDTADPPRG
jgi:hypothetical protein